MIIRTSGFKGAKATYKRVRGPDGGRVAKFRSERTRRYRDRFAIGGTFDDRRAMRNARKRERQGR
jgi:hypothetical protein